MSSSLFLCLWVPEPEIVAALTQYLSGEHFELYFADSLDNFHHFICKNTDKIDSLIVSKSSDSFLVLRELSSVGTLLPAIIIELTQSKDETLNQETNKRSVSYCYHSAEIEVNFNQIKKTAKFVNQAISQFLYLVPSCSLSNQTDRPSEELDIAKNEGTFNFLSSQQKRLSDKLKERLGYLGVYYKRSSQAFFRNFSTTEKKEFRASLKAQYQQIILSYFLQDAQINAKIDDYVNRAFFADISASQILEIHMELIEEFSQQLKLEGRSEEILLDYRLTLIDVLAHLAEMYRRSIPREERAD